MNKKNVSDGTLSVTEFLARHHLKPGQFRALLAAGNAPEWHRDGRGRTRITEVSAAAWRVEQDRHFEEAMRNPVVAKDQADGAHTE